MTDLEMDRRKFLAIAANMLCLAGAEAWEEDSPKAKGKGKGKNKPKGGGKGSDRFHLPEDLAEFERLSVVLGRPEKTSVVASILAKEPLEAYLEYGPAAGKYSHKTKLTRLSSGVPFEQEIRSLAAGAECYYRLRWREVGSEGFKSRPECRFRTQPKPGSSFTFTIQGDSHPERPQMCDAGLYARTLMAAAAEKPDFHICMGDDFSVKKLREFTPQSLMQPYLIQRPFLGLIGQTAPLYLINGNHEQASMFNFLQKDVRHSVAVGVQVARNKLYPLPNAGGIYSTDRESFEGIGPLKDYYAWTWGDALFVVLDNYWHSPALVDTGFDEKGGKPENEGKRNRDWWGITIGDEQYFWLKRTLENSRAKFKFVFAHHVLGSGRGGTDMSNMYEWGGQGKKGNGEFKQKRPKWELPIHQLMAKHGVSIFFQGHDHLYAKQEKDGIVYQEVPVPGDFTYSTFNDDAYDNAVKLPNSGYLRVNVDPKEVTVEYVRSYLANDERTGSRSGQVAHKYSIKAKA